MTQKWHIRSHEGILLFCLVFQVFRGRLFTVWKRQLGLLMSTFVTPSPDLTITKPAVTRIHVQPCESAFQTLFTKRPRHFSQTHTQRDTCFLSLPESNALYVSVWMQANKLTHQIQSYNCWGHSNFVAELLVLWRFLEEEWHTLLFLSTVFHAPESRSWLFWKHNILASDSGYVCIEERTQLPGCWDQRAATREIIFLYFKV